MASKIESWPLADIDSPISLVRGVTKGSSCARIRGKDSLETRMWITHFQLDDDTLLFPSYFNVV